MEIVPDSANPSSKVMSAPQAVDLELLVVARVADGRTILDYTLNSPSGVADFTFQRFSSEPIVGDPESYHARLIRRLEKLSSGLDVGDSALTTSEVEAKLEGFGRDLYRELFPEAMRAAYRRFRTTVRTFLIISQEPWIPWELVKPYDATDPDHPIDDDFLCEKFQLTRWLAGLRGPAVTISVGKLACLEAGSTPQTARLPHALKERRVLTNIATSHHPDVEDASPEQATFAALKELIRQGGLGLLHIAAHGDFDAAEANAAEVVLADGKPFRADDLHGPLAATIAQDRPLVFLNACRAGGQNWQLTHLGRWAEGWVALCGCGAFIGPQWVVDDEAGAEFVRIFYNHLAYCDSTFAVAAQAARRRLRALYPGNPAWLAFAVYAHPNGRVMFGTPPVLNARALEERMPDPKYMAPACTITAPYALTSKSLTQVLFSIIAKLVSLLNGRHHHEVNRVNLVTLPPVLRFFYSSGASLSLAGLIWCLYQFALAVADATSALATREALIGAVGMFTIFIELLLGVTADSLEE